MATTDTTAGLTSTTAPGKVFATRVELAEHYQTQWHQYNLKRRQAGLPMLLQADFEARLAAATALRQETRQAGTDHLKQRKVRKDKKQQKQQQKQNTKNVGTTTNNGVNMVSQVPAYNRIKQEAEQSQTTMQVDKGDEHDDDSSPDNHETVMADTVGGNGDRNSDAGNKADAMHPEKVEIDPLQSLFDRHLSASVPANVERMYRKYGFFVPDREFCTDLEGLVGYLHEKIKLGHMCIYCHRVFTTWQGCQKHMISKQHCKIRYEAGIDLEDLDVFYDFKEENERFLQNTVGSKSDNKDDEIEDVQDTDGDMDDEEGWEDISDDEEMEEGDQVDEEDEDAYSEFEEEVARMGLDVTSLGELVFPDGRIVGHRSLRRYYKQRAPHTEDTRASVQAARLAAGERLYRGRVFQLGGGDSASTKARNPVETSRAQALALSTAGVAPGLATGRAGKGILVASSNNPGFTQVSVYRFRAVLRKQRREDDMGKRLMDRTRQNINRMDKKANRLRNNVSVAHAAR